MKRAFSLVALLAAMAASAPAGLAQGGAQGGDRAQMMSRVIDGINSPDPVTRIITLEQAMASRDNNVERVALAAAFASSDQALRAVALEALFATKSAFIIEFTGLAQEKGDRMFWTASAGRIEVVVSDFDPATGNFMATTPYAHRDKSTAPRRVLPGNLSGDRLSFSIDVADLSSSGGNCKGAVVAEAGSTVMTGTMSCAQSSSRRHGYTIRVDMLR